MILFLDTHRESVVHIGASNQENVLLFYDVSVSTDKYASRCVDGTTMHACAIVNPLLVLSSPAD